jgi:hypothetical protein
MKQKDIALVLVVCFVSAVLAFFLSNWLFGGEQSRGQKAETIDVITSEFRQPPEKYFNTRSVNPTKLIEIGGNPNPNPFGNGSQ